MLLVDGKPYSLSNEEVKEYGTRIKWHVQPKPYDKVNDKHGISEGVGFPNVYTKKIGAAKQMDQRVVYYTQEEYDDTLKKTHYKVDNTGSTILIGNKGVLTTSNAELNFFLYNSPYNGSNPFRQDEYSDVYAGKPILFYKYNPAGNHKHAADKLKAKKDLHDIFDLEGSKPWSDTQIISACKTLNASADRVIPQVLIDWNEYKDEEGVPALRNGLQALADMEPLWLKNIVLTGRKSIVSRTINKCLENVEFTGFSYSPTGRKYIITKADGKVEDFLVIPDKKDPDQFLLEMMFSNHKQLDKLSKLLDKLPA